MCTQRYVLAAAGLACAFGAAAPAQQNAYVQTNLVSNLPELEPQILDPLLLDGWGIAIRPPGAGGHFWITNAGSGTVTTYVGDVPGVPLYQDDLEFVSIPSSELYEPFPDTLSQPTGQVYTGYSLTDFMVSGEGIEGPSKFVFVTLDGSISAWTTGQAAAVNMVDDSLLGSMYTGVAVTELPEGNRLYVADFGLERVVVYNHLWQEIQVEGDFWDPAVPPTYSQWNMQYLGGLIYVTFARIGDDPGEEDQYPGYGGVAAFDTEGRLVRSFEHGAFLNAPWGLAIAPKNFGALSGSLLVGNFADGTTVAYDRQSGAFIDYLRGVDGEPLAIDGLWGFLFGNGVRLGYTNHLYFAAGPNGEEDGLFGKLEPLNNADANLDGALDLFDFLTFVNLFVAADPRADYDGDGAWTLFDYLLFVDAFNS